MFKNAISLVGTAVLVAAAFWAGRLHSPQVIVSAQTGALTAQDYAEITQLINRYAYGIDTCGGNGFDYANCQYLDADVNATLRRFIEEGQSFDAIVLDPPKFAPTIAHAERAARAYKDINRLAFKLLAPGGMLLTFSCSGGIGAELFHKIVASAGIDAGVDGFISERLGASPDHPMTIEFPEGEYLKGLVVVRKLG